VYVPSGRPVRSNTHGLEHAVDAAAALDDDYTLLLIGEGPRRAEVARRAAEVGAPRVEMRPLMSPERAAHHLRAADAVLVSESQERTVSAKLYDVCAIGRPVIAACRGELRRVIESEGIALAVEHGDSDALAAAVRRVRSDDGLRAELSANGREFAARNLREHQARRFAEIVEAARS
jgi:glycosyltransferase involved in cell wall biosynthesis